MLSHALIVEDDPIASSFLVPALQSCARQITALRVPDALRWARAHQPSVVLIAPPRLGADVERLVRALKVSPETWALPVLRLRSAHVASDLEVQADEELRAPFDGEGLHQAVRRALLHSAERARNGTRAEVRLRLRSNPTVLGPLAEFLTELFRGAGLDALPVQKLALAVRELAANAIEWGHRNQPDQIVRLHCRLDADKVGVAVRDTGPGFDPRRLPHAASADDPLAHLPVRAARNLRDGGFGILLAGGLVDELRYNDVGNEARLVLYFAHVRRRPAPALSATS